MQTSVYQVKLDNFEGPLDLLLYLVKQNEMDIYNIQISRITDQYLEYIKGIEFKDIEYAADFLVMAATLIYIKSKTLLPMELAGEEEVIDEETEQLKKDLSDRLIEYSKYKYIAGILENMSRAQMSIFSRVETEKYMDSNYMFIEDINIYDLTGILQKIIFKNRDRIIDNKEEQAYSILEKMKMITKMLKKSLCIIFSSLSGNKGNRKELIVALLAILELVRQQKIIIEQKSIFGEIIILTSGGESNGQ